MNTIGHNSNINQQQGTSVFAIVFDLDTKTLEASYPQPSWQNAYTDIGRMLRDYGFGRMQGSVYFGDETVDAVQCVLAVQDLTHNFSWFGPSVRDIRMLRIEDNNDLMPAVDRAISRQ